MPNLFDPAARAAIRARVDRLTANSQARWGRMNVGQMLVHCGRQLRMGLGELPTNYFPSPVGRFPLKHLVIYLLPTPRSVPTLPELRDPVSTDWQHDRDELRTLIDRFAAIPRDASMPVHGAFGRLSHTQWGLLAYKHLDHHLKQFGA